MNIRSIFISFALLTCNSFADTILPGVNPCVQDTLANYSSNFGIFGGACSIGQLSYARFGFLSLKPDASTPASTRITAADLLIKPAPLANSFDILPIDLALFNPQNLTQAERYLIVYSVDPPPIIAGDDLRLDPPVGPVFGTKWGCKDVDFAFGPSVQDTLLGIHPENYTADLFSCGVGGALPSYILQTNGLDPNFANVNASITFDPAVSILNIRLVLDFLPGSVNGFEGIQQPTALIVPEPSSLALLGGALVVLALRRRQR